MQTTNKEFLSVRSVPLWIHVIQYGIIALFSVPLFREIEKSEINYWRLSILIIAAILLLVAMIVIDKRYYKPKPDQGLFLEKDKFIYAPNSSLRLEVDWKNVELFKEKGTGVSNYIIPVLKDIDDMRILKAGWFGKRLLNGNIRQFGMPVVINPHTLNTSEYDLSKEFKKYI